MATTVQIGEVKCEVVRSWSWSWAVVTVWRCVSPDGIVHELTENFGRFQWLAGDGLVNDTIYESMEDACIAAFGAWAA